MRRPAPAVFFARPVTNADGGSMSLRNIARVQNFVRTCRCSKHVYGTNTNGHLDTAAPFSRHRDLNANP
jgi:hypothetical protein